MSGKYSSSKAEISQHMDRLEDENAALRARVAELEQQELKRMETVFKDAWEQIGSWKRWAAKARAAMEYHLRHCMGGGCMNRCGVCNRDTAVLADMPKLTNEAAMG